MKNAKRLLLLILTLCMLAFTACAGEEAKNDNSGDSSANSVDTPSAEGSTEQTVAESGCSSDEKLGAQTGEPKKEHRFQTYLDTLSEDKRETITIQIGVELPDDLEQYVEDKAYEITGLRSEDITDALDIETVQNYIRTKRAIHKEIFHTQTTKFADEVIIPNGGTDVSCSIYTPRITFCATKSEAEIILGHPGVAIVYPQTEDNYIYWE